MIREPSIDDLIVEVQSWLINIERTQERFGIPADNANVMYAAILSTLRTAAANERDAARYRWLRSQQSWDYSLPNTDPDEAVLIWDRYHSFSGESIDAAIDAAAQLAVGEK